MRAPAARRALPPALLCAAATLALGHAYTPRHAALFVVALLLGISLYHAAFGFTGAFRAMLAGRRTAGFRAQLLMLGTALLLFTPALAAGQVLGQPVRGFVFPVGIALLVGAFLFGIGMQLGGGCGSGTLYTAGGGASRMWITLASFVAGATLAAWQEELWFDWPALPAMSFAARFGAWPALAGALAVLALAWAAARALESGRHGTVEKLGWRGALLTGPWPLAWGALALAVLNFATLVLAGRPWAITAAFPLWGSKLVEATGIDDPAFWPFWEDPTRTEAFLRPLLADVTTIMDLGVMAGAFLAARLALRDDTWRGVTGREAAASVVGGLLLGIGAVLAFGCNISAWFGGIASASLHGWVWFFPALAGNALGVRLRPWFRLDPRPATI